MLFRPPDFFWGSSSDFSGVDRVISSNPATERNRVPAEIGRYCRIAILSLEHGDRVAVLESHDCLLPGRRLAPGSTPDHLVPPHLHGANGGDGHPEQLLERVPDVTLGRAGMDLEGVFLPILIGRRALLGHQRLDHDAM